MQVKKPVAQPLACITPEAVQAALDAALKKAQDLDVAVNIALVDNAGHLAGFIRQVGAFLHSIDIAIDKAYTAVSFGLPTVQWHEALQNDSVAVREGIVRRPRFVVFGGGLPIVLDGQRIGGIGVSGASEAQDGMIAQAGLDAIVALAVGA